jgi:hypothetical protein
MSKEIFSTQDYPNIGKVTILDGKGIHWFNAMIKAKGESALVTKFLMLELILINDKPMTEEQLDNMLLKDISYFNVIIGQMMSNDFVGGI